MTEETKEIKNIQEAMVYIQANLNAPKNQKTKQYNYRSCEDVVEAVKKICLPIGAFLKIVDDIVLVGDFPYVKATATLVWGGNEVSTVAWAREDLNNKFMSPAQNTGATSSYARKYALNGLFAIDDNKDFDSNEYQQTVEDKKEQLNKKLKLDIDACVDVKGLTALYSTVKPNNEQKVLFTNKKEELLKNENN